MTPPRRLPDDEWEKRYIQNHKKQEKRKNAIRSYLIDNENKKITCKDCLVYGNIRVTTNTLVKIWCHKCKNSWFIKIKLPKELVPKKFHHLIK